jgi:primosomal replication protein N
MSATSHSIIWNGSARISRYSVDPFDGEKSARLLQAESDNGRDIREYADYPSHSAIMDARCPAYEKQARGPSGWRQEAHRLNRVMVIGHLGQDPEIRYTPAGMPVVNLSVATDEPYVDKEGKRQERVEWHKVVVIGKLGLSCHQYLSKGRQVVCCESFIGDGGVPPGVGLQEQIPNRHKLRG